MCFSNPQGRSTQVRCPYCNDWTIPHRDKDGVDRCRLCANPLTFEKKEETSPAAGRSPARNDGGVRDGKRTAATTGDAEPENGLAAVPREPDLRRENEDLQRRMKEFESRLESAESEVRVLTERKTELERESIDLKDTIQHLLNVNRSLEAIDAHGIVEHFLEFSTGMYNAVLDNDDIEKVRELADARLDQLSNSVSSRGMELRFHRRGETLTEGRVDHIDVPTDDPDLDMTVKRSIGFGFSFGSDAVSDIVERVSVYVYVYDERKRRDDARAASTYGIEACHDGRMCIYNMIRRGTPFDDGRIVGSTDRPLVPISDDESSILIRIYESDRDVGEGPDGDFSEIGEGTINIFGVKVEIPSEFEGRARGYAMRPTLRLDRNGTLTFEVTDANGRRLARVTRPIRRRSPCPENRRWSSTASATRAGS